MAKSLERIKARELRKQGVSVREIAKILHVSKSTASLWVRDIILSLEQLEKLRQQNIKGGEKGRILGALKQKQDRLERIQKGIKKGKRIFFHKFTTRELLIAGTALYWAEGTKGKNFTVTNSDPLLIAFMVGWFKETFKISPKTFKARLNIYPQQSEIAIKKFWSDLTSIPIKNFGKTFVKPVSKGYKKNICL